MTEANPRAVIGANNPPAPTLESEVAELVAAIDKDHAGLFARATELLAAVQRAPVTVDSDDHAGKVATMRRQLRACWQALDEARKDEKRWFDGLAAGVHGHFGKALAPLVQAMAELEKRETAYLTAKADRERKAREADLAAAREREAAVKREQEEAARQVKALAELQAKAQTPDDAEALAEQQEEAEAEAQRQRDAQLLAEAEVSTRQRAAEASPSQMARSQSNYGATSTLRRKTVGRVVDREKIDWSKLGPYFSADAIEKAIAAAIKAGVTSLPGIEIKEEVKSVNR